MKLGVWHSPDQKSIVARYVETLDVGVKPNTLLWMKSIIYFSLLDPIPLDVCVVIFRFVGHTITKHYPYIQKQTELAFINQYFIAKS